MLMMGRLDPEPVSGRNGDGYGNGDGDGDGDGGASAGPGQNFSNMRAF